MGDKCEWKQDENGVWETDCGNLFEITEGTPTENYLKFCPYCGKHLIQVDGESCGKEVHVAGSIQGVA